MLVVAGSAPGQSRRRPRDPAGSKRPKRDKTDPNAAKKPGKDDPEKEPTEEAFVAKPAAKPGKQSKPLFPVKLKRLWGYIDARGKIVIQPRHLLVFSFSEGRAMVRDRTFRFGYIDERGRQGRAVDDDEWALGPRRAPVDEASDELLARAVLSGQEDAHVSRREAVDEVEDPARGR